MFILFKIIINNSFNINSLILIYILLLTFKNIIFIINSLFKYIKNIRVKDFIYKALINNLNFLFLKISINIISNLLLLFKFS